MEFGYTESQEKLRREVRGYLLDELPSDIQTSVPHIGREVQEHALDLQRKMGSRRWLTPGWSPEYGGLGLGPIEQALVEESSGYWMNFWPNVVGLHFLAPILFVHGTGEQKKKYLPPIARGEVMFWQCFTEPNAGSDESNAQLRAVEDGNDYVLNGQKMFNGGAFKPDYLVVLTRTANTEPKHKGLTIFIVPANTPGITYRALPVLGGHESNEIYFDNVRVSKDNMLGKLNGGFYCAMAILQFERSDTGWPASCKRMLEEFVQFCKEHVVDGKPLIKDPKVRQTLADMAMSAEVWRLSAWYAVWRFKEREKLGPQSYDLTGYFNRKVFTLHAKGMMDIMGMYGQLRGASKWSRMGGSVERLWQRARSKHGGGTIEIHKNILAQRGLGLPRRKRAQAREQTKPQTLTD